jgi:hypothetical protein
MASLNINDGGVWKQPREVHCREFNQWFAAREVYIKENGTWVKVWARTNQVQNFAVGGEVYESGNYRIHVFREGTGTFELETTAEGIPVEYLIVGGGGPGGVFVPESPTSYAAGGGGGGQVIIGSEELESGSYEVVVGEGGSASLSGSDSGESSSFNGIVALGGGAGAANFQLGGDPPPPTTVPAASGGAGSSVYAGTPNTPGLGYEGGASNEWGAGGGGGAAGAGGNGGGTSNADSFCGDGGVGVVSDFTGISTGYGGGGAGISVGDYSAIGTQGGGSANENGEPNTGGGGGALEDDLPSGGSGIVAIRYLYNVVPTFSQEALLTVPGTGVFPGTEVGVTYVAGQSSPIALPYHQWQLDGETIASSETYVVQEADRGKRLQCVLRLENRLGHAESVSNPVTVLG